MLGPHARSIYPRRTPLLLLGSLILAPHVRSAPTHAALRGGYPLASHSKQGGLPPLLRTRGKKEGSALEGRALSQRVLSLRGGGAGNTHASDPTTAGAIRDGRQPTQSLKGREGEGGFAYYDVDGTLYDGTMAHTAWWFIVALPSRMQRASKAIQMLLSLPLIALVAVVDESRAARLLAYIVLQGVTTRDAEVASEAVTHGIGRNSYAEVLEHLKEQQEKGRATTLLTGNVLPMVSHLGRTLGCTVVGTEVEQHKDRYTGHVRGEVCVGDEKRARHQESLPLIKDLHIVGVGNSMYDVPFLEASTSSFVVRPSSRLRRLATARGWDLSLSGVRARSQQVRARSQQ
ncbi:hypothetical protein T484DRAFT_1986456, partial [Baffinella frigidus]